MSGEVGIDYFLPHQAAFSWPTMWDPSGTKHGRVQMLAKLVLIWCAWGRKSPNTRVSECRGCNGCEARRAPTISQPEPPSFSWPSMWDPSETRVERLRNLASLVTSWCDWGEEERRDSERDSRVA